MIIGLVYLLEALSIVFCVCYLYGENPKFDVTTVSFVIIDVIWMSIVEFSSLGNVWTLMMYPIAILYCGLKFGFDPKAIWVNNILYMVFISAIQATGMIVIYQVFDAEKTEALNNLIIGAITFVLIIIMGLRKNKLKKFSNILQSNEKIIIISLVVVGINIIMFLLNYKHSKVFNLLYYSVLGISILLIIIAVIDIGKHKIKAKEAEAELRIYKLYEPSFRELVEDIRARQHEFDNHINAIYSQHYNYKTYDELVAAQKKYCSEIVKENRYNKLLSHGDHAVTSFLYSRFLEAEKRGIEVSYRVCIEELECRVPVHKLVELLGNLVNNAMDAVETKETGKMYFGIFEGKDIIQIEVANVSEIVNYNHIQNYFRKGYSEKGKDRGYGLHNVKRICDEYNIVITCENKQIENKNWLVFNLIIKKPL